MPFAEEIYDIGRDDAMQREFERNCRDVLDTLRQLEQAHGSRDPNVGRLFRWYRTHAEKLILLQLDRNRRFPLDTFLCQDSRGMADGEKKGRLTAFFEEVEVPLLILPGGRT